MARRKPGPKRRPFTLTTKFDNALQPDQWPKEQAEILMPLLARLAKRLYDRRQREVAAVVAAVETTAELEATESGTPCEAEQVEQRKAAVREFFAGSTPGAHGFVWDEEYEARHRTVLKALGISDEAALGYVARKFPQRTVQFGAAVIDGRFVVEED